MQRCPAMPSEMLHKKTVENKKSAVLLRRSKKRTDSFQNPSAFITHRIYPASREKSSFAKFAVLYAKIT